MLHPTNGKIMLIRGNVARKQVRTAHRNTHGEHRHTYAPPPTDIKMINFLWGNVARNHICAARRNTRFAPAQVCAHAPSESMVTLNYEHIWISSFDKRLALANMRPLQWKGAWMNFIRGRKRCEETYLRRSPQYTVNTDTHIMICAPLQRIWASIILIREPLRGNV